MFEKPSLEILPYVISGECLPPEFWKLNDSKTDFELKTEEEILANDWNESIERRCEYFDYLEMKIEEMETFLNETDWYVTRKAETDKDIPTDVSILRSEYRTKISDFKERLKNK